MFVHFVHMVAQRSIGLEWFLTIATAVIEATREVDIFNVVPDISLQCVFFSTQGALEAWPLILKD